MIVSNWGRKAFDNAQKQYYILILLRNLQEISYKC
jgi:hypothetical protein